MKSIVYIMLMFATINVYSQNEDSIPDTTIYITDTKFTPKTPGYFIYLHLKDKTIPLKDSISKAFFETAGIDSITVGNGKQGKIVLLNLSFIYFPKKGRIQVWNMYNPRQDLIVSIKNVLASAKPKDKIILDEIKILQVGGRLTMDMISLKIVP